MARVRPLACLLLTTGPALLLTACGGGTKTVTAANVPPVSETTQSSARPTTQSTQRTSTQTQASTTGSSTRSAPEPAFTKEASQTQGSVGAAALVRAHGYTPNDTSQYHTDQALGVLVGTRTGSADGYGQQAFFFINGLYLGTDTKLPSATVKVISQADTEVTLGYPLYRQGDPLANPSGGEAHVTFQLNNGKLVPLQKIPPAASNTGLSRQ